MEKKLKIILCILIIALLILIAFVGIYAKNQATYDNILPDYLKSSELKGKRITNFKLSTATEEVIYDKDGNKVDSIPEGANEEDYRKEQESVNKEESLNTANYETVKKIFENRLKEMGVSEYAVRLNKTTGAIAVELPENSETDRNIQYLLATGEFTMSDEEDGTVLLDMKDVKSAVARYGATDTGTIGIYLTIKFNKEGAQKLSEVSKNYQDTSDKETNSDEENSSENTNTVDDTNTVEDTNTVDDTNVADTENKENSEENNHKHVVMTIEGIKVASTYFTEELNTGELTLTLGTATTQDTLYDYLKQAQIYAMILNNGTVPVAYEVNLSEYIENTDSITEIYTIVALLFTLALVLAVLLIFKYRKDGIIAGMSLLAMIAMLLILIRYTNTPLSIGSIVSILILLAIEFYFITIILDKIKKDNSYESVSNATLKTYLEKIDTIIVLLIISVVFTFMNSAKIYSIGMTLFYGIISIAIANLVFMRTMLLAKNRLERKG